MGAEGDARDCSWALPPCHFRLETACMARGSGGMWGRGGQGLTVSRSVGRAIKKAAPQPRVLPRARTQRS